METTHVSIYLNGVSLVPSSTHSDNRIKLIISSRKDQTRLFSYVSSASTSGTQLCSWSTYSSIINVGGREPVRGSLSPQNSQVNANYMKTCKRGERRWEKFPASGRRSALAFAEQLLKTYPFNLETSVRHLQGWCKTEGPGKQLKWNGV